MITQYFKPVSANTQRAAGAACSSDEGPRGPICKRPAATPSDSARGGKRRPNAGSFDSHSGTAAACKKWDTAANELVRGSTVPALTGRVLITVMDRATPLSFCSENSVMTNCSCSLGMRLTQQPGDVLLWVSSQKPSSRKRARGLITSQRLVLRACISSGSLTVPQYMSNAHGAFACLLYTSDAADE